MKERPILFKGEMVRAILEGRKTQTRRVVKHVPGLGFPRNWCRRYANDSRKAKEMLGDFRSFCPYGQPGDRLWVREKMCLAENSHSVPAGNPMLGRDYDSSVYAADGADTNMDAWPWKNDVLPSIHMPKGASRITLEITNVRVERLQDISEEDAKAEGVLGEKEAAAAGLTWYDKPRRAFRFLWQSINGASSWDANPWVWVVEFKRVEKSQ